jgi:hypothetical protein
MPGAGPQSLWLRLPEKGGSSIGRVPIGYFFISRRTELKMDFLACFDTFGLDKIKLIRPILEEK